MPQEKKTTDVMYVKDGFGHESWHYAASEAAAQKAHRYHFFGTDGLHKQYREEPKVIPSPMVLGNKVCVEDACCNFAGVPKPVAERLNSERIKSGAGR